MQRLLRISAVKSPLCRNSMTTPLVHYFNPLTTIYYQSHLTALHRKLSYSISSLLLSILTSSDPPGFQIGGQRHSMGASHLVQCSSYGIWCSGSSRETYCFEHERPASRPPPFGNLPPFLGIVFLLVSAKAWLSVRAQGSWVLKGPKIARWRLRWYGVIPCYGLYSCSSHQLYPHSDANAGDSYQNYPEMPEVETEIFCMQSKSCTTRLWFFCDSHGCVNYCKCVNWKTAEVNMAWRNKRTTQTNVNGFIFKLNGKHSPRDQW